MKLSKSFKFSRRFEINGYEFYLYTRYVRGRYVRYIIPSVLPSHYDMADYRVTLPFFLALIATVK